MVDERGPLQRALDDTGLGVTLEAEEATLRAAYGDDVVDEAIRRCIERVRREALRHTPRPTER